MALFGCGGSAPARPADAHAPARAARADRFDAGAAWRLIELELRYGQRPAGTPQLRALAVKLRARMPHGRFEAIRGQRGLRNVVGSVSGSQPPIVIGAHYDTLAAPKGFVGANNGAAGSAIVVQLARTMAKLHRAAGAPALRFVLFDGEEPPQGLPEQQTDFYDSGLRGSRAYVAAHPRTRAMVLLDYVANKGLRLPREGTSDVGLWARIRAAAKRVGAASFFPPTTEVSIIDDHSPFLREGVPAVDMIDWSYPGHQVSDTLDKLSRGSVDAVGETLVELLRTWR